MGLWSGNIPVKRGGRVALIDISLVELVLETSVAFIVCIEPKNEVFCGYSTDSVGCCVLH